MGYRERLFEAEGMMESSLHDASYYASEAVRFAGTKEGVAFAERCERAKAAAKRYAAEAKKCLDLIALMG